MGGGGKGGGGSSSPRQLTTEEKNLIKTQDESLKSATKIAAEQFKLSKSDRTYFDKIYRGEVNPNSPEVRQEVADRIAALNPPERSSFSSNEAYSAALDNFNKLKDNIERGITSGGSVDKLLFTAVKESSPKLNELLSNWEASSYALGSDYINSLNGLSDDFKNTLTSNAQELDTKLGTNASEYKNKMSQYEAYTQALTSNAVDNMGTVDEDVYARTKGQNLAGISQAFRESQDRMLSTLSRRGLAGSGVEARGISDLYQQEALTKSNALSMSYNQAVQQSDAMRMSQLSAGMQGSQVGANMAGGITSMLNNTSMQQYGANQQTTGQVYGAGTQTAGTAYGVMSNLEQNKLSLGSANVQQGIANYQLAAAAGNQVYAGASNMLAGAGSTFNQSAATAGSTAVGIGSNDTNYRTSMYAADQERAGATMGGLFGTAATGLGAYAALAPL